MLERLHTNIDTDYKKQKEEWRADLVLGKCWLAAITITSVALNILGFSLCAAAGGASLVGTPILMVGLPISFLAVNLYKVLDNAAIVIENTAKYAHITGTFNKMALRQDLLADSNGVSWAVDYFISTIEI